MPPGDPPLKADLSLIRVYTRADEGVSKEGLVEAFENEKKQTLLYAGIQYGKENTHKIIDDAIETINKDNNGKPPLIIIYGVPTDKGVSPQDITEYAKNGGSGDNMYAVNLANQKNISYMGGELSDQKIFSGMGKKHSAADMMEFYLARQIPQWREELGKEGKLDEKQVEQQITGKAIAYLNSPDFGFVPQTERLTFEKFEERYRQHNSGKDYLDPKVTKEDFAPFNDPSATYYQKMNADLVMVREAHLDATIAEAYKNHDKVLVIYGDGHLIQSREVFKAMFKAPDAPAPDNPMPNPTPDSFLDHAVKEAHKVVDAMNADYANDKSVVQSNVRQKGLSRFS